MTFVQVICLCSTGATVWTTLSFSAHIHRWQLAVSCDVCMQAVYAVDNANAGGVICEPLLCGVDRLQAQTELKCQTILSHLQFMLKERVAFCR